MRQIVLDTETTGLDPLKGDRVIEIGCVEIVNRRVTDNVWHQYINPDRPVGDSIEVHGIADDFLTDKPRFADVVSDFMAFVNGAELIIHNAQFDLGFLDHELAITDTVWGRMTDHCTITDSLIMARQRHPGQKNNLDALCKRYEVNNARRELHGALLDAELLAEVYLRMTGGQVTLSLGGQDNVPGQMPVASPVRRVDSNRPALKIIRASVDDLTAHNEVLKKLGDVCLWNK